ncbi:hypothetical protein TRAPUB_12113 [Trametes pubescens]|uniref:Uncharacterized protein n=1 Tax=Trametes pubescens TaxID=154538 RepID=A0A1M2VUY0_TRAPU|nr:hypothetical protein TRAPUB_12113 [Trametes pubescens]
MPNTRFPHNARGYLYYYLAPNAPALSGQIRFRVTGTNDPALFSSGEDLLRADHLPWRIPVVSLPRHKYYAALLRRLVDDGLVSEHLAQVASSSPCDVTSANVRSAPRIVHAFGQPFLPQFGQAAQPFYFIGAETVLRANFVPLNIVSDTAGIWGATIKVTMASSQARRSVASRSRRAPSTQGAV